jgi:membrane associated rhomboid family serine protease
MATSLTDDLRRAMRANGNALHRLIIYNVVVYVIMVVLGVVLKLSGAPDLYATIHGWLILPSWLTGAGSLLTRPWTLLTYAFVHEEFFHILFNMMNLYWFGMLIREYLGARRLVSLYILGSLVGALLFLLALNFIPELVRRFGPVAVQGASGGVVAIIVGAATLLPDYTFMLILLGPVRIKWIAAVLVLLSVSGLTGGNAGGQAVHLGGALLGFVYIKQLRAGRDLGAPVQAVGRWFSNLFGGGDGGSTSRPAMRVTSRGGKAAPPKASNTADQVIIDQILDKINRSGYESLTKEEKQQLFRASQK